MRKLTSEGADLVEGFGVQCGRWTQYGDLGEVPFGAMWCVVPPGGSTSPDTHDERELVIVADGAARFESPGSDGTLTAAHGATVLVDGGEAHVVHNQSQDQPLVLLCLYWLPNESSKGAGHDA
jgi:mannose-6-phosphate isomerase-like protein (cupin superfamily)